jgi:hypothetical protein
MSATAAFADLAEIETLAVSSPLIRLCLGVALEAHAGQSRKTGEPYVSHPVAVALRVAAANGTESEIAAALLHDVVEDCPEWPVERLVSVGIPLNVLSVVLAVSKAPGAVYRAFIASVALAGLSAIRVKRADLADNSSTLHLLGEKGFSLGKRYAEADAVLAAAEEVLLAASYSRL